MGCSEEASAHSSRSRAQSCKSGGSAGGGAGETTPRRVGEAGACQDFAGNERGMATGDECTGTSLCSLDSAWACPDRRQPKRSRRKAWSSCSWSTISLLMTFKAFESISATPESDKPAATGRMESRM
eukprot:scaffold81961_cov30-Tisochrysis_lutea.AAC.3